MSVEEVEAVATGAVFTAEQAKELRLIDEIGYLETAIEGAKKLAGISRAEVIRYSERASLLKVLLRGQGGAGPKGEVNLRVSAPGMDWPRAGLYYIWEPALTEAK
jgi:protease-4